MQGDLTWRVKVKEEESPAEMSREGQLVQRSSSRFAIEGSLMETGCLNKLPNFRWVVDDALPQNSWPGIQGCRLLWNLWKILFIGKCGLESKTVEDSTFEKINVCWHKLRLSGFLDI